jgi:hypothetical protein
MIRSLLSAAALGLTGAAFLFAAPFWVEKPYQEWSQKEVAKLLSDSPWTRSATVDFDFSAMRGGLGGQQPGPGMGGPGMGGPGMGGPGMGGPGMGGPGMSGMPEISATVMWRSALPIRQAMYQAAVLQESPAAEALERALGEEPAYHILALSGLPNPGGPGGPRGPGDQRGPGQQAPAPQDPGMQASGARTPPPGNRPPITDEQRQGMEKQMEARMLANTTLTVGNETLAAERMERVQSGEKRILLFYFPKSRNLQPSDKEAKFETQMGPLKIAATFKAKDMIFATKPKS